ncbi:MAG: tRNA (adenosine(37)-N6)-threonylcarbamoyltransferase complex transferase subunit TsaD [Pseudanabaenaceae cyanobacterium SKYGB_i_bin29]|nr:tRNA (adenosine(37)-N6)-threonylcarbamoyltransferase complex transferase subunit TsaD [Pseudanabaenaceae cyanobacterium SKYG29]MDW8420432.1 tRNA (adenosine(37)-N6)-threonylcarbamoyltransferase complex transferase subunit TsaD [Pseudanabaenaceae cyanobacterium SKYGB_i_bin29]
MAVILGIETSCDETAVAVVSDRVCLSNVVASQIDIHREFGGVVPELASRRHLELINPVLDQALAQSGLPWSAIDAIAVTVAPGLIGALMVGVTCAKTLALIYRKPLIGIHHLEGHICSCFLEEPNLEPPFLCLMVSGGHSSLIVVQNYSNYQIVGRTRDDAAGEAFDKVARLLNLGYPGGPIIDRVAQTGNPHAYTLPQGKISDAPYDFSFSGLKTAVLRLVEKLPAPLPIPNIAASFQLTVAETLVSRTLACALEYGMKTIVAVGGVAANSLLRQRLISQGQQHQIKVIFPPLRYCTDNAAMIACAGGIRLRQGCLSPLTIEARSRLSLEECEQLYYNGAEEVLEA